MSAAKVPPSKDESDKEENVVEEQNYPTFGEEIEQKISNSDEEPFIAETSPEPKEEKAEEESVEDADEATLLGEEIDQETFAASQGKRRFARNNRTCKPGRSTNIAFRK